jgi:hypothetical protein
MGSIARVNVNYIDLCSHFEKTKLPLFGTFFWEILFINADYPRELLSWAMKQIGISKDLEKNYR